MDELSSLEKSANDGKIPPSSIVSLHYIYESQQIQQPAAVGDIFLRTFNHLRSLGGPTKNTYSDILPSESRAISSLERRFPQANQEEIPKPPASGHLKRALTFPIRAIRDAFSVDIFHERRGAIPPRASRFNYMEIQDEQIRLLGPQILPGILKPLVSRGLLMPAAINGGKFVRFKAIRKQSGKIPFYFIPPEKIAIVKRFLQIGGKRHGFHVK
ncbi:MAG: hypothetical protein V1835_04480 [Candidatus Micrarchaeota archaeon]